MDWQGPDCAGKKKVKILNEVLCNKGASSSLLEGIDISV